MSISTELRLELLVILAATPSGILMLISAAPPLISALTVPVSGSTMLISAAQMLASRSATLRPLRSTSMSAAPPSRSKVI